METSANDFYDSLNTIGLVQYHDEFVREAFNTWEVLIDIPESDLDALGVKLGHRRILQRAISDYRRKNSYDESSYHMVEEQNGVRKADPVLAVDEDANGNGVARVSVNGKRRYKRHPKADEYAPDRPPSAYVLFSNQTRADLKGSDPSFTEIAKTVGERWRVLAQDEKATYESRSQAAKDKYYSQLSGYKKTSKFAEYQIYLADFKAKHEPPPHGGKRKRDDKLSSLTSRCSNGTDAGASSPENSYLHAESSLDPRSSFVEFPSSSNTPDFKNPKYTPSQSTTRQCNAAAADSSSISPRLPKPRFAPKPTPERQKPATLPLLPPYKETVCVSEYAFTTHINHPMAISTQLAYGYIPNLGNNLPSTSRSSSSLNNNSATPPDASLEKVLTPSTRVRTPDFLTSIEGPANEGGRMADRRLAPLLMGRGNRYVGQGQASPLGAVGITSLLRAGEHLEGSGSPGGSTREGDRPL
ncbi:hypothetical protein B0A48_18699 [Cryoendolithus antarcticus]|uniref:HMG box domain-containing protein n=1 Tax=Cryoendolithus antarcticus TaxID=1507870 RepID=A0A1V8S806_9PEZI|nr:hypothetical protein B0A48_18699 [Cryoendolithus antarcticus]